MVHPSQTSPAKSVFWGKACTRVKFLRGMVCPYYPPNIGPGLRGLRGTNTRLIRIFVNCGHIFTTLGQGCFKLVRHRANVIRLLLLVNCLLCFSYEKMEQYRGHCMLWQNIDIIVMIITKVLSLNQETRKIYIFFFNGNWKLSRQRMIYIFFYLLF